MFDYFKLGESDQFQFLQLPWLLIKDEQFKKLSDSSKILYSLLLNRTSLSAKNGWVDDNGNIYIIYTIEQIMEDLCCAAEKATKVMKELKDIGLIKSIRRGLGKPNLLYVMNFATDLKYNPKPLENSQTFGNRNSGFSEIEILDTGKIENQDFRKSKTSNTNHSNKDFTKIDNESKSTSDGNAKQKKDMTLTNDNHKNNEEIKKAPVNKQAETLKYNKADYDKYERQIKENISYAHFAQYDRSDIEMIDGLVQIMLDVILTENPSTVKIGKESKSRDIIKSVYLKLNCSHIQHIISQYKDQHHKITYKTAYLRTMLYTVYSEIDAHYTNLVRADGAVW